MFNFLKHDISCCMRDNDLNVCISMATRQNLQYQGFFKPKMRFLFHYIVYLILHKISKPIYKYLSQVVLFVMYQKQV